MKVRSFRYLTVEGLKNVWTNRLMSLASIGVLMACMLLMGIAIAFSLNIEKAFGDLEKQNVIMAYFEKDRPTEDNLATVESIKKMDNIANAIYITKEEGLKAQLEQMGEKYAALFEWVAGENPLPDSVMIYFVDLSKYDETFSQISQIDGIENVNGSKEIAKTITAISKSVTMAGFWIIALLLLIALVIIANTIRITMHNRRLEISIMKAVGATNWFIRIPFIVEGMALGIVSGLLTTGGLYLVYRFVVREIILQYPGFIAVPFRSFCFQLCGLFITIGLVAGIIGSIVILGKYLKREGSAFGAIH